MTVTDSGSRLIATAVLVGAMALLSASANQVAATQVAAAVNLMESMPFESVLEPPSQASPHWFGYAMATTSNSSVLMVGAPQAQNDTEQGGGDSDGGAGAVFVYERTGMSYNGTDLSASAWGNRSAVLRGQGGVGTDPTARFGFDVDVDRNGGTIAIVGAPFLWDATGGAYAFCRRNSSWWEQTGWLLGDATEEYLGYSVALDAAASVAIVSSVGDALQGSLAGAVHVLLRSGDSFAPYDVLRSSQGHTDARFGYTVSIAEDASTIFVGSPELNYEGAVLLFEYSPTAGTWVENTDAMWVANDAQEGDFFGGSLALNANASLAAVGAFLATPSGIVQGGAVYLFALEPDATTWTQSAKLVPQSDPSIFKAFGFSVALRADGDRLAVGAVGDFSSGMLAGAAYIFVPNATSASRATWSQWSQEAKLVSGDGNRWDNFGQATHFLGASNVLAVGSFRAQNASGAVYFSNTACANETVCACTDRQLYVERHRFDENASYCVLCPAGSYWSEGEPCTMCPPGTFTFLTGETECTACPAGRYASGRGNVQCALCDKNEFSQSGAANCTACPSGEFSDRGASSCGARHVLVSFAAGLALLALAFPLLVLFLCSPRVRQTVALEEKTRYRDMLAATFALRQQILHVRGAQEMEAAARRARAKSQQEGSTISPFSCSSPPSSPPAFSSAVPASSAPPTTSSSWRTREPWRTIESCARLLGLVLMLAVLLAALWLAAMTRLLADAYLSLRSFGSATGAATLETILGQLLGLFGVDVAVDLGWAFDLTFVDLVVDGMGVTCSGSRVIVLVLNVCSFVLVAYMLEQNVAVLTQVCLSDLLSNLRDVNWHREGVLHKCAFVMYSACSIMVKDFARFVVQLAAGFVVLQWARPSKACDENGAGLDTVVAVLVNTINLLFLIPALQLILSAVVPVLPRHTRMQLFRDVEPIEWRPAYLDGLFSLSPFRGFFTTVVRQQCLQWYRDMTRILESIRHNELAKRFESTASSVDEAAMSPRSNDEAYQPQRQQTCHRRHLHQNQHQHHRHRPNVLVTGARLVRAAMRALHDVENRWHVERALRRHEPALATTALPSTRPATGAALKDEEDEEDNGKDTGEWFVEVATNVSQAGPFSAEELLAQLAGGDLTDVSRVRVVQWPRFVSVGALRLHGELSGGIRLFHQIPLLRAVVLEQERHWRTMLAASTRSGQEGTVHLSRVSDSAVHMSFDFTGPVLQLTSLRAADHSVEQQSVNPDGVRQGGSVESGAVAVAHAPREEEILVGRVSRHSFSSGLTSSGVRHRVWQEVPSPLELLVSVVQRRSVHHAAHVARCWLFCMQFKLLELANLTASVWSSAVCEAMQLRWKARVFSYMDDDADDDDDSNNHNEGNSAAGLVEKQLKRRELLSASGMNSALAYQLLPGAVIVAKFVERISESPLVITSRSTAFSRVLDLGPLFVSPLAMLREAWYTIPDSSTEALPMRLGWTCLQTVRGVALFFVRSRVAAWLLAATEFVFLVSIVLFPTAGVVTAYAVWALSRALLDASAMIHQAQARGDGTGAGEAAAAAAVGGASTAGVRKQSNDGKEDGGKEEDEEKEESRTDDHKQVKRVVGVLLLHPRMDGVLKGVLTGCTIAAATLLLAVTLLMAEVFGRNRGVAFAGEGDTASHVAGALLIACGVLCPVVLACAFNTWRTGSDIWAALYLRASVLLCAVQLTLLVCVPHALWGRWTPAGQLRPPQIAGIACLLVSAFYQCVLTRVMLRLRKDIVFANPHIRPSPQFYPFWFVVGQSIALLLVLVDAFQGWPEKDRPSSSTAAPTLYCGAALFCGGLAECWYRCGQRLVRACSSSSGSCCGSASGFCLPESLDEARHQALVEMHTEWSSWRQVRRSWNRGKLLGASRAVLCLFLGSVLLFVSACLQARHTARRHGDADFVTATTESQGALVTGLWLSWMLLGQRSIPEHSDHLTDATSSPEAPVPPPAQNAPASLAFSSSSSPPPPRSSKSSVRNTSETPPPQQEQEQHNLASELAAVAPLEAAL